MRRVNPSADAPLAAELPGAGRGRRRAALAGLVVASLGFGFLLFTASGRDDAHIAFFPAHTLLAQGELLNYNGERVEQASSLAFVVLVAVASFVTGVDVAVSGYFLPIVFGALTVVLAHRLARRLDPAISLPTAALVATAPPLLYWTFGKMEVTLAAAALLGVVLAYDTVLSVQRLKLRHLVGAGSVTIAFVAVRPESPLVLAVLVGSTALAAGLRPGMVTEPARGRLRSLALALLVVGASTMVVLFRCAYFGAAFPQPVYAKAAGLDPARAAAGLRYVVDALAPPGSRTGWLWLGLLAGGQALATALAVGRRGAGALLLTSCAGWSYLAFVVFAGGDWMEGGRFVAVVLPLLLIGLLLSASAVLRRLAAARWRAGLVALAALVVALQLHGNVELMRRESHGLPLPHALRALADTPETIAAAGFRWFEVVNRTNGRDLHAVSELQRLIERLLGERRLDRVHVLSGQQGLVTYTLSRRLGNRLRVYDRHGLVERSFTHCATLADWPRQAGGLDLPHELALSEELLSACGLRRPEIVYALGASRPAVLRSGYVLYFQQLGPVPAPRGAPGPRVAGDQSIYLRADLAGPELVPAVHATEELLVRRQTRTARNDRLQRTEAGGEARPTSRSSPGPRR